MKKFLITFTLGMLALASGLVVLDRYSVAENNLGAFRPSGYKGKLLTRLDQGGTETTFNTTPCTTPDGQEISTSATGDFIVITVNPGADNEEKISASASSCSGTTLSWTIVNRGLSFIANTAVTANKKQHSIGETVIISNDDHFLDQQYADVDTDESINANWSIITPTSDGHIANKAYVDAVAAGAGVSLDSISLAATAGETFATGTIVYFDATAGEWLKASAATTASSSNVQLGIAQGAGTDGATINGGVLTRGYDETQSGMTVGQTLYLSDTTGATSTSAGTISIILGQSRSASVFYFDPIYGNIALKSTDNTFTGDNTFSGTTTISGVALDIGIENATAGETISGTTTPIAVYKNTSDGEVYAVDGNATSTQKFYGFAVSSAGDGESIRVKTEGIVDGFSSLLTGQTYYVQDDASSIATSTGTYIMPVGTALSSSTLLIKKYPLYASGTITSGLNATASSTITTGFIPTKIIINAANGSDNFISTYSGIWANNILVGVSAQYNEGSSNESDTTNRLYGINGSIDYITFSITNVTQTGFTINWVETNSVPGGSVLSWTAEGEY